MLSAFSQPEASHIFYIKWIWIFPNKKTQSFSIQWKQAKSKEYLMQYDLTYQKNECIRCMNDVSDAEYYTIHFTMVTVMDVLVKSLKLCEQS